MEVEVNYLGVFAAAAMSLVIGGIWYSKPVFGKMWIKLAKIDEKKAKEESAKAILGMLLFAILMAYVLAHVTYLSNNFYVNNSFQSSAVQSSFWMWLGFVVPATASNSLFNQAPWKVTLIHTGNWLVTLLGMGFVIGFIGL